MSRLKAEIVCSAPDISNIGDGFLELRDGYAISGAAIFFKPRHPMLQIFQERAAPLVGDDRLAIPSKRVSFFAKQSKGTVTEERQTGCMPIKQKVRSIWKKPMG